MSSEYENLKKRYADEILRRVTENPQAFLDLDSPSERPGRRPTIRPKRGFRGIGIIEPATGPSEMQKAIGAGISDGFTFGAADEIGAAGAAMRAWIEGEDAGDAYDHELKRARAEATYLQEQHPFAYGGGAVAGSLVQPATYLPVGWVGRGAVLASNAGKAANLATKSINLAKVGAIDGGVYGFNSGSGGFGDRFRNAAKDAALGATIAGSLPGAGQLAAKAADPLMDRLAAPIIRRITRDPHEAALLLEKARLMRLVDPNSSEADLQHILRTAYDTAINKGRKTADDLTIMHRGLFNKGLGNARVSTTTDRMNKIGKSYVGSGFKQDLKDTGLLSADEGLRYRQPAVKKQPHVSAQSNVQANLERDFKRFKRKRREFHNNLHVDIIN